MRLAKWEPELASDIVQAHDSYPFHIKSHLIMLIVIIFSVSPSSVKMWEMHYLIRVIAKSLGVKLDSDVHSGRLFCIL